MSQSESLIDRTRFAVDNPDVLHTPAMYREIIAGLVEQNEKMLAILILLTGFNPPAGPGSPEWNAALSMIDKVKGRMTDQHQPISSTADAIEAGFPAL